jgi:uncharacterized protein YllA (UPF0747 family)
MKVVLSRRVEAELVDHFEYRPARFGSSIAVRRFLRSFIFETLLEASAPTSPYHPGPSKSISGGISGPSAGGIG